MTTCQGDVYMEINAGTEGTHSYYIDLFVERQGGDSLFVRGGYFRYFFLPYSFLWDLGREFGVKLLKLEGN